MSDTCLLIDECTIAKPTWGDRHLAPGRLQDAGGQRSLRLERMGTLGKLRHRLSLKKEKTLSAPGSAE